MTQPPPRSPLFPYTTLFRSEAQGMAHLVARHEADQLPHDRVGEGGAAHRGIHRDRKSTRLNSSHMSISYAVFCLKKKKKIKMFFVFYSVMIIHTSVFSCRLF